MAPVEFEKEIKERLEERRIRPSEEAWEKISRRLAGSTPTKKGRYYSYAIAASLVGILLLVIWINQSQEEIVPDQQPVVNSSQEPIPLDDKGDETETPPIILNTENSVTGDSNEEEGIAFDVEETPLPKTTGSGDQFVLNDSEDQIEQKVEQIVAQLNQLEERQHEVSDEEVDSLLRHAQRELLADQVFRKQNGVDAASLLAGVEDELDQTFRDQVFERLKTGFTKVRMAVAQRNK